MTAGSYELQSAEKDRVLGSSEHTSLVYHLAEVGTSIELATTATEFYMQPPIGEVWVIDKINIMIMEDIVFFDADNFGALPALTNGCTLKITRRESTSPAVDAYDLLDGLPMKNNFDMAKFGNIENLTGTTRSLLKIVIDFADKRQVVRLDGKRGERLVFKTQDDLSLLDSMNVIVYGRKYKSLVN